MRASHILVFLALVGLSVFVWRFAAERVGHERDHESSADTGLASEVGAALERPRVAPEASHATDADTAFARAELSDDSPRLFGRVQPLGGWPADERAELRAEVFGAPGALPRVVRIAVGSDGRFELRVPATTRHAMLAVESERLYQSEETRALPGQEIVLEPLLLASVEGSLRLPTDASDEELARVAVHCSFEDPWLGRRTDLRVEVERDGAFRLRLLPPEVELALRVEAPWAPAHEERLAPLVAGERRALVVELTRGLRVSGFVLDENGTPFSSASVDAYSRDGLYERASVDNDGRFELTRLARQPWSLEAVADEGVASAEIEFDGQADAHGLVLTLRRGACLTGSVRWPDGSPVHDYGLELVFAQDVRRAHVLIGDFRECGLLDEECSLEIEAATADFAGRARVARVRPGGPPLELVLTSEPAFTLELEVKERNGAPIEFLAKVPDAHPMAFGVGGTGHTTLSGLPAGRWLVLVEARGFRSSSREVELGAGAARAAFVLDPCARIRGRVEDAEGRAVPYAQVEGSSDQERQTTQAGSDGVFDLDARAGTNLVHASAPGLGASETLTLILDETEILEGIVLRFPKSRRAVRR